MSSHWCNAGNANFKLCLASTTVSKDQIHYVFFLMSLTRYEEKVPYPSYKIEPRVSSILHWEYHFLH